MEKKQKKPRLSIVSLQEESIPEVEPIYILDIKSYSESKGKKGSKNRNKSRLKDLTQDELEDANEGTKVSKEKVDSAIEEEESKSDIFRIKEKADNDDKSDIGLAREVDTGGLIVVYKEDDKMFCRGKVNYSVMAHLADNTNRRQHNSPTPDFRDYKKERKYFFS